MFRKLEGVKGLAVVSLVALSVVFCGCGTDVQKSDNSQKVESAQSDHDKMIQEIATGWNTETTNVDKNSGNWEKATDLVKKYPDYLRQSEAYRADAQSMLKKPWEFYGKVISIRGRIYSIEQRPPGDSVVKFYNRPCYTAMLEIAGKDAVYVAVDIIDDAEDLREKQMVDLRGYIYGHTELVNAFGGKSKGLCFIGFLDKANTHMKPTSEAKKYQEHRLSQNEGGVSTNASLDYHWFKDTRAGVLIWNPMPTEGESVSWQGGYVKDGDYCYADGNGVATWYLNGAFEQKDEGTYVHGYREGAFTQTFADGRVKYSNWHQGTRVD